MPLGKDDNPSKPDTILGPSDSKTIAAKDDLLDAGAGAPESWDDDVEALPENDAVEVGIKDAMQADSGQEEAQAKVKVVNASPDAAETPSGFALKKTAGISDNTKRGEEYSRIKSAVRHGYVPATAKDLEAKK